MGAGASSLLPAKKISSANELILKTKDVREMSNALFTFMFSQWDDKEIWEISKNPGDYVVAVSDLITAQFHVLGYTTKRNQIGEIYFEKYSKLKPPREGEGGERGAAGIVKHRENTQMIAFYFIRLFQIMGALLLVVKDISFPMFDPTTQSIKNIGAPEATQRPYVNQEQLTLARFKGISRGGGSPFPKELFLGPYEFLRYYLSKISSDTIKIYTDKYGVTLLPTMYQISPNLFFEYTSQNASDNRPGPQTKQKFWLLTRRDKKGELKPQEVYVSSINPILPGNLPPGDPSFSRAEDQLKRYPLSVTIQLHTPGQRGFEEAVINRVDDSRRESYSNGAEYKFQSGTRATSLLGEFDPRKEFTQILDRVVLNAIIKSDPFSQLYRIQASETEAKAVAIGEMPKEIKAATINELYKSLSGSQPHCIARAIQLLDTKSIHERSPVNGKTSICKFAVGDMTGSVPLSMYKPIKSLAQLYGKVDPVKFKESIVVLQAFVDTKDTSAQGEPLSISMLKDQPSEAAALSAALNRISEAFAVTQTEPFDGFSGITVSKPKKCTVSGEQPIQNTSVTLALQSTAHQLMAYHVNHTIEIAKFLKVIFNITQSPNGSWKVLGPRTEILFAGFPVLNQLTDQARELLVDYYSKCEMLYQTGLKTWSDAQPEVVAPTILKNVAPTNSKPINSDSVLPINSNALQLSRQRNRERE